MMNSNITGSKIGLLLVNPDTGAAGLLVGLLLPFWSSSVTRGHRDQSPMAAAVAAGHDSDE
jgi:hypothetical protein